MKLGRDLPAHFVHKELYFIPETLPNKSKELLEMVLDLRRKHSWTFVPDRAALLVLDMQDYFLSKNSHAFVPSGLAIIPGIRALIAACTSNQKPVVFTRHLNDPQNAGMMTHWWHDLIREESPYSRITAMLDTFGETIVEKSQYDAFYATRLEELLRLHGVTQVVICGVMAHLCCETTARSAFMRGFEVFFTIDGTATYNEAFHKATLINLAHGFAIPVLVEEILKAYECRA